MMRPALMHKTAHISGFTLLEMLFTVMIAALLFSLAAPAFQSFSAQSKAKNSIHKLSGVLRHARNHAVHYQKPVLVCPSEDGVNCLRQDWQRGIMVFEDRNQNRQAEASETLIYFQAPFIEHAKLSWNGLRNNLLFSELGLPSGSAGSFVYCPNNGDVKYAHGLIISFSGKIRLAEDYNRDGIRESGNHKNLVCPN